MHALHRKFSNSTGPIIVRMKILLNFSGDGDNILPSNKRYHCSIVCVLKLPKFQTRTYKRNIWSFSNTKLRDYQFLLKNQDWDSLHSNDID